MLVPSLVLCLWVGPALACGGGGGGQNNAATETVRNFTIKITQMIESQSNGTNPAFHGFLIPANVSLAWKSWLDDYQIRKKQELEGNEDYNYGAGGPGSGKSQGWPSEWAGLGKGDVGFPPDQIPPWGYQLRNQGLPPLCYLYANSGTSCGGGSKRWGFNGHMQECMEFNYLGCGGNANNFRTKEECEKQCSVPVSTGCDQETDILERGLSFIDGRRCGHRVKDIADFEKSVLE